MTSPSLSPSRCLFVLLLLLAVVFSAGGGPASQARAAADTAVGAAVDECQATPSGWDSELASADNAADSQECALLVANLRQDALAPSQAAEQVHTPVPSLALSRLDRPPRPV